VRLVFASLPGATTKAVGCGVMANKHQPFDDHTLQLLNAAVWFVEQRQPAVGVLEIRLENPGERVVNSSVETNGPPLACLAPLAALTTTHSGGANRG
jgi:hypothetical protein